jgi:hypothetical protein
MNYIDKYVQELFPENNGDKLLERNDIQEMDIYEIKR